MTEVDILNQALGYLGEARVQSLTQASNSAKVGSDAMRSSVEEVLEIHDWNSALERQTLSRLSQENKFGPKYSYQLPNDFMNLTTFNDGVAEYRIEGKRIVTDETEVEIVYVAYPTDFSVLDASLVRAIASNLAFNISINVTGEIGTQGRMLELHERFLARARTKDARESSRESQSLYEEFMRDSPMLKVRRQGSRHRSPFSQT